MSLVTLEGRLGPLRNSCASGWCPEWDSEQKRGSPANTASLLGEESLADGRCRSFAECLKHETF